MASVRIPAQLRSLTGGDRVLNLQGSTVSELIEDLEVKYPGFKERLLDPAESRLHLSESMSAAKIFDSFRDWRPNSQPIPRFQ